MRAFPSQDLFLNPHYLNSRLLQEVQRRLVRVALLINDLLHPGVDHHLGAEDAGLVGAIERCPLDADAVHCRLNDGVLLGMHRPAELVACAALHIFASTADEVAVVEASGRAVITRGEYSLILHEKRSHLVTQTGRPLRYHSCDLHEILVQAGAVDERHQT
jgi:hypothetical protein